jgi:hypothetical protein
MQRSSWYGNRRLWLELFALINLGFLAPDIYLAHSVNLFHRAEEYLPFVFSLLSPVVLFVALIALHSGSLFWWRWLGFLTGWASVAIGIIGLILHLGSRFFYENTLDSLVYTAPFAAPLAYTGIGLLILLNRIVDFESAEWAYWVIFLALGGFVGNFIFSLADHAQNGFYFATEWIPVAASALSVGFLMVPFFIQVQRPYESVCAIVMVLEAAVGLLGFYYHVAANLNGPSADRFDNFVYGAPAMAPLLFPNLALLTFMGLEALRHHLPGTAIP